MIEYEDWFQRELRRDNDPDEANRFWSVVALGILVVSCLATAVFYIMGFR